MVNLSHQSHPRNFQQSMTVKVLYAEDNVVNQKVLSRVLNRTGITDITIVDNGKKAVDVSADTKFDCIFMDMQMPVMKDFSWKIQISCCKFFLLLQLSHTILLYLVWFFCKNKKTQDGMEACKHIIKRDPAAKIIFVTAHALDEVQEQGRGSWCCELHMEAF